MIERNADGSHSFTVRIDLSSEVLELLEPQHEHIERLLAHKAQEVFNGLIRAARAPEIAIAGTTQQFRAWRQEKPEERKHVGYAYSAMMLKGLPENVKLHRIGTWRDLPPELLAEADRIEAHAELGA